jgi:hypothetical protein
LFWNNSQFSQTFQDEIARVQKRAKIEGESQNRGGGADWNKERNVVGKRYG